MKWILLLSLLANFSLSAKDITYKVDGKEYEGYFLKKSRSAPTVFIVHDWDGIGEYEKKRSKMLFDLGYSVFAADLYGKGIRPQKVEDKKAKTSSLYKNRKLMRRLMNGAMSEAKKQGLNVKKAVALGYCFGGTSILEWARTGIDLAGFASFHGGLVTPKGQSYKNTKSKIIIFHGTADKIVTMEQFAAMAVEMEALNIPHEMITYSGAPHAFSVMGSERYRKEADEKSWARFTAYLKEQL